MECMRARRDPWIVSVVMVRERVSACAAAAFCDETHPSPADGLECQAILDGNCQHSEG